MPMDIVRIVLFSLIFCGVSIYSNAQYTLSYTLSTSNAALVYNSAPTAVSFTHAAIAGDDAYSDNIAIGFSFTYACQTYTYFGASTNGWLGLGTAAGTTITNDYNGNNLQGIHSWPIIAPLWDDLALGAGNVNYQLTGAAGSRILTIEWKKVNWNYAASNSTLTFQVKLYEGSNNIEFIYMPEGGVTNSPSASIGLSSSSGDFYSLDGTGASPNAVYNSETANLSTVPASGQHYLLTKNANLAYSSSTTVQMTGNVSKCGLDQEIIQIQVVTSNTACTLTLTQIQINMTGSTIPGTNTNDVSKVHIYYSGISSNFNKMTEFVSGGMTPAAGTMTFNGSVNLSPGTNYFWVAYDLNTATATTGNVLDARCTQITVGGVNQTPTVTSPAGTRSIVACITSPGGVNSGLAFWVKANAGTSSTTNNTAISAWNDQSGNARNASQATAANQPTYYDNATNNYNFNPVVDFNDAAQDPTNGDFMDITSNNILPSGKEAYTVYAALLPGTNNSTSSPGKFLHSGGGPNTFCAFDIRPTSYLNDSWDLNDLTVSGTWTPNYGLLATFDYNYSIRTMYVTGSSVGTKSTTNRNSTNTFSALGCQTTVSPHIEFYDGSIAEIITYPNISHSQATRYRVETYLATKYGITLSHDYVSSKGVTVWSISTNASYNNNIIGIARDDNSVFSQKQSKSTSTVTDIQTLSIGPTLKTNQASNTGSFTAGDQSYFYSGNNGGSATFAASAQVPSGYTQKLGRQWLSQKNNFTNTDLTFTFDLSGVGAYSSAFVRFLVDDDGNFTNASYPASTTMTFVGNILTVVTDAANLSSATPYYTLAISNTSLPVSFLDVDAMLKNGSVTIDWSTTNELNNDYFDVERSVDGKQFESITKVKAGSNSTKINFYSAIDPNPYTGNTYYRIEQIDQNGNSTYSKIVTIDNELNDQIQLFPNPVNNYNLSTLGLSGFQPGKEITVVLSDLHGQEIFRKALTIGTSDKTLLGLDSSLKLTPGEYLLTVSSDQHSYNLKLVITEK